MNPILDARTIFFPHYQLPFSSDNSSFHWSALLSSFPKLSFSTISFISFHFKVSSLPTITFLLSSSHQTPGASRLHLESSTTFAVSQYSSKFNTWNASDILYILKLPNTSFELAHCNTTRTVLGAVWSPRNTFFVVSGGEEVMALLWKVGGLVVFEFEVWGMSRDGWVPEDFSSVLRIDMTASPHDIGQVPTTFNSTMTASDGNFLHLFDLRICGGVPAITMESRSAFARTTVNFDDNHSVRLLPSPRLPLCMSTSSNMTSTAFISINRLPKKSMAMTQRRIMSA